MVITMWCGDQCPGQSLGGDASATPIESGNPVLMSQQRKSSTVAGVDTLRTALAPLRDQLLNHPIYASVNTLPRLRCFMRYHVFAVWVSCASPSGYNEI